MYYYCGQTNELFAYINCSEVYDPPSKCLFFKSCFEISGSICTALLKTSKNHNSRNRSYCTQGHTYSFCNKMEHIFLGSHSATNYTSIWWHSVMSDCTGRSAIYSTSPVVLTHITLASDCIENLYEFTGICRLSSASTKLLSRTGNGSRQMTVVFRAVWCYICYQLSTRLHEWERCIKCCKILYAQLNVTSECLAKNNFYNP